MTTTTYDLYKLRATVHDHPKCLIDPITSLEACKILEKWYIGQISESAAVVKLTKLGIIDEDEKGV